VADDSRPKPNKNTLIIKFKTNMDKNKTIPTLSQTTVIGSPIDLEPILAQIEHINDLGKSLWYEVVYYDGKWCSYAGSKTFENGEKVVKCKYAKDCL
jgi:hypothetical protein